MPEHSGYSQHGLLSVPGPVGVISRELAAIPHLEAFLGAPARRASWLPWRHELGAVAGLGRDEKRGRRLAGLMDVPFLSVAEGFLRPLGGDPGAHPICSLVADASGIYYDATRPSDLENLLNAEGWETPELLAEARRAMDAVLRFHLGVYNRAPAASPYLMTTPGQRTRVLLLDQAEDDPAVSLGLADASSFAAMVAAARRRYPGAALFVKPDPAVLAGEKKGWITPAMAGAGVTFIDRDVSSYSLLAQADAVYAVSSPVGFEALLMGKRVHCFGLPFYAGWGLTADAQAAPRRKRRRTAEELFAAAVLLYSRYANPVTGEPCSAHDAIRLLAEQRRAYERSGGFMACLGFARRQRLALRAFLPARGGAYRFFEHKAEAVREAAAHKGRVFAPSAKAGPELARLCGRQGVPLVRVEEGFWPAREGEPPVAMIFDPQGRQADSSLPSRLETLLAHTPFPQPEGSREFAGEALLSRARALRERMARHGVLLEPYGLAAAPPVPEGRAVILVPGRRGGEGMADRDVLSAVRAERPDAHILYAPHPRGDVAHAANAAGSREAPDSTTLGPADAVLLGADMLALFALADEVHVGDSLAGLDALLRGRPVHTHGEPFYAGWGLTADRRVFPRRSCPLTLDALLAAALILYPSYYDWHTRMFCTPEDVLRLREPDAPRRPALSIPLRLRRFMRDRLPSA